MSFARAANLPKGLGRNVLRRAGPSTRNRSWRQIGRRGYASGHGEQKSSELPWMIGSAAVTIPAAAWLLQQGPKKGDHGHGGHDEHHESKEEDEQPQEEESKEDDSKDESNDESKDEGKDDNKDDGKDQSEDKSEGDDEKAESDKSDGSGKDKGEDDGSSKGPGEGQKGTRAPTEKKGEKDAQGDHSGAKHPYIDDPEKSKKGVGVTETARIHGTVDSRAPAQGPKSEGSSSEE